MLRTTKYVPLFLISLFMFFATQPASAQERLCDTSFEDCRTPLWTLIDNETVGIDVAFWFMQDTSYATKLINKHNAGVPIRILVDPRANPTYAGNEAILNQLKAAGIPMRYKVGGGILHWKMMLFAGQNKVEFSGANYSPSFFVPSTPYQNYIDEAIYFTDDPAVVNSFKTKYDDNWTDTSNFGNFGNITGPLTRKYPTFPIDPAMNFPPSANGTEDFYNRSAQKINNETQKIDIIMYRHTNDRYTNDTINARARGIPVRFLTEQNEYRNLDRQWDAYNIDLLYNAGVQIRIRNHLGLNHEKAVLLYGQGMTIFGSSNWTGPSSNSQTEHNYFTTKAWIFQWFVNHFERKWNSTETQPFTPLPPDAPSLLGPSDGATGQPTTNMELRFEGGPWAHKFDIYFGTSPTPPLIATNQFLGRVDNGVIEKYTLPQQLLPGTTYYWRIVSKTMANMTATGPVWRFTTAGTPPNPGPAPTLSSISPNSGSTSGGTSVTISGTNFQSGATVNIGGSSATSINVVNATTINAVTPAHAAGAVNVVVTNTDTQSATLTGGFTYTAPPPPPPPPPGAGDIVLYASEAAVKVGNWQVVADSTAAGGARIANSDQGAAKRTTALANPTDYFEMSFPAQSGTAYRLWMRGKAQNDYWGNDSVFIQFSGSVTSTGGAIYRIGTTGATEYNLEDCSGCGIRGWGWQDNGWGVGVMGPLIYFEATGQQTIRVQVREDGLSIDQIVMSPVTYVNASPGALKDDTVILPKSGVGGGGNPAPTISGITPTSGPTDGETNVTILGSGFLAGASVRMGGEDATGVVVVSSNEIRADTPLHTAGAVDVVVTNTDNQSATLTNGFTYTPPAPPPAPTVSSISPTSGPTGGGTNVTIGGSGFTAGAGVTIGGAAATSVVVVSSSQITAVTPAHAAGAVNIVVTNSDNQSGTLANGFTYTTSAPPPAPTVTSVSPTTGSTAGGTAVTITGTGFLSGAVVEFGGVLATNVVVVNSTSITATTPPHTAGSVDVIVTNSGSQSGTLPGGFVYSLPSSTETILLQDNFNDNSLDLSKWNKQNLFSGFIDTSIPVNETSQRIEFGPFLSNASGSHYVGIRSVNSFNFSGAYCYVELVQAGASNTSTDAMFTIGKDANSYYRIYVEGSTLVGQKRISGGNKVNLFTAAYVPANDRYWRIRHDSTTGNVIFETAPDNGGSPGSWTVRFSEAWNTSAMPLGSVLFEIKGGTWQPESNAPGKVIFDNFKAAKP